MTRALRLAKNARVRALCLLALTGLFAWGCKRSHSTHEEHEQRCLNGDRIACARACERGIHGPGGCMEAVHDDNPMRRTKMLTRACDARQAGACSLAAEASIALGITNPVQYRKLLSRACEQNDARGCNELGNFLLGESLASAEVAYANACRLDAKRAPVCNDEITKLVAAMGEQQTACNQNDLEACERLLVAAAPRNHDFGYLAGEAICRLRGLTQYYRSTELRFPYKLQKRRTSYEPCGLFLLERAITDPKSLEFERTPLYDLPSTANRVPSGRVTLALVAFHFRDAPTAQPEHIAAFKAAIEAGVRERLELVTRCYERHLDAHPDARGKLDVTFIVDKLGAPLELRTSGELTDPVLSTCVLAAAIPERFAGSNPDLGSIVRVEVGFELVPTAASAK